MVTYLKTIYCNIILNSIINLFEKCKTFFIFINILDILQIFNPKIQKLTITLDSFYDI